MPKGPNGPKATKGEVFAYGVLFQNLKDLKDPRHHLGTLIDP